MIKVFSTHGHRVLNAVQSSQNQRLDEQLDIHDAFPIQLLCQPYKSILDLSTDPLEYARNGFECLLGGFDDKGPGFLGSIDNKPPSFADKVDDFFNTRNQTL
ncbi:hypothetical protein HG530_009250 [Fusarium avenaceum]|nr:hypothetical protein HG530_009250 [Fusarium avenaceum]